MNKKISYLIICMTITILVGCNADNTNSNNSNSTEKNILSSTSGSNDSEKDSSSKIELTDDLSYYSPFIFNGTDLIFSNPEENNRISIIPDPIKPNILESKLITDFADYSADSIALIKDTLYFSNGSENNSLCSIDINTKDYKKINTHSINNLTNYKGKLVYTNKSSNNRLFVFDTSSSETYQVTSDSVGYFIINYIIYQNLSDNSKIYSIKIDGSERQKLTDYTSSSFTSYDNELLFFNSSDNNNLYSFDPSTSNCKRLCIMNGSQIQNINNSLYFINQDDYNYIYSMTLDLEKGSVKYSPEIKENVNKYYATAAGIFYESSLNVNNIKFKEFQSK